MRGHSRDDDQLRAFLAARTGELHRAAYLLTADQDRAERLVESVIGDLRRHETDLGQGETTARRRMVRMAGTAAIRPGADDDPADPRLAIAALSPRERAVLMLRSLEGHDLASTARELGLSRSRTASAEESASQSLGFAAVDDAMRQALTDFAEEATWPDPDTTLARSASAHVPRRHSRKRYAAVAAILALTAAAPIGSQFQHNNWLRTPAGINASHGTHLHPYTQGYKLVGIERVPAGGSIHVAAVAHEVIAPICRHFSLQSQKTWARLDGDSGSYGSGPFPCAKESTPRYFLLPLDGTYTISAPADRKDDLVLGRYLRVPWEKYPVAKSHFIVERDLTVKSVTKFVGPPTTSGVTVTLHGTNGVASAIIPLPAAAPDTDLYLTGVFSPTTTGEYKITLDGRPVAFCDASAQQSPWCRMYDRHVAQIRIIQSVYAANDDDSRTVSRIERTIRVEAQHVSGPWTLQLRYVREARSN